MCLEYGLALGLMWTARQARLLDTNAGFFKGRRVK
jgi:hypothetical protein